ncbi:MAG: hypothetical protein V4582_12620 [Pseudomonadota bacterium]
MPSPHRRRAAGVGLVTAIFILVVLSGLAVAMMSITSSQQASSALDIQGARAYQAARAGIEWGLFQQLQLNVCPNQSITPAATTLSTFTVTVTCARTALPAAGAGATNSYAANLTSGLSTIAMNPIGNAASLVVGMRVAGTGITPGTRITNINTATGVVTLSTPATATSGLTLNFISALDRWRMTANACNQAAAGSCPNTAPSSKDYVARQLQVDF